MRLTIATALLIGGMALASPAGAAGKPAQASKSAKATKAGTAAETDKSSKVDKADREAAEATLKGFRAKPELKGLFKSAFGYAVFPTVGHGAFGVGVAHGEGLVYRQGALVAKTSMTQVSVGLGAGGEAYSELIFFKDSSAFERFAKGDLEMGARATAVAVDKHVATDADYTNGVAVVTATKGGLMADASVGGQKFSFEKL